jgi:choline kinase
MTACKDAVILAAGLGSRIRPAHPDAPKGFIEIGGQAIIRRSIQLLLESGVQRVVIVCGHLAEHYEQLSKEFPKIQTIRNERYAESGSMHSLWCARGLVKGPFLLLESDLVYERRALVTLQDLERDNAILLSGMTNSGDEVYVEVKDGRVCRMSKQAQELNSIGGELVGISTIAEDEFEAMSRFSETWFRDKDLKLEYERCINGIIENGFPVYYEKLDDLIWAEIDDADHLTRVREKIFPAIAARDKRDNGDQA